ncbi:MAG TPA: glycosyltransferase family 2 protein [Thermodesulfovibrionales bacterium]|nr:glycosyltransferase family 2 protein [Thermodesulfovibrionales bacterium]
MRKATRSKLVYSTSSPVVLIVIVNWDGKDDLLECLTSIKKLDYPKDKYKVLVIDNGSGDGSQSAVSNAYPEVRLFKNEKNIGYVNAVNQGITYGLNSGVDYIWIFNNDVVVGEDSMKRLIEVGQQDERIGVIAPVIYSYDNPEMIDNIGYKINFWTGRLKKQKYGRDLFRNHEDKIADVDSCLGCSNLIKASVFKKVGLFQTIYELYFEETDFNVRARQKGYRVVVAKEANVWHKNASTMNKFIFRRACLLLRNLFLFELLNAKLRHLSVFIPYYFLIHLPYFLIYGSIYGTIVNLKRLRRKFF